MSKITLRVKETVEKTKTVELPYYDSRYTRQAYGGRHMKQHTLQEIADFFGCYLVKESFGLFLHSQEPVYKESHYSNAPYWISKGFIHRFDATLAKDFTYHDPRVLVRPKESN